MIQTNARKRSHYLVFGGLIGAIGGAVVAWVLNGETVPPWELPRLIELANSPRSGDSGPEEMAELHLSWLFGCLFLGAVMGAMGGVLIGAALGPQPRPVESRN